MHNNLPKIFYFINDLDKDHINKLDKNIAIIFTDIYTYPKIQFMYILSKYFDKNVNDIQNLLDKKKISRYPRYISMKKIYQPKIKELDNNDLILQTISSLLK